MLTVIYDEMYGSAIPDGQCEKEVLDFYEYSQKQDFKVCVSSETFITALRVLIKEKKIDLDKIQVKYKDEILPIDSDGRCNTWPKGFCDTHIHLLERLF